MVLVGYCRVLNVYQGVQEVLTGYYWGVSGYIGGTFWALIRILRDTQRTSEAIERHSTLTQTKLELKG